jgi:hypothetical protein
LEAIEVHIAQTISSGKMLRGSAAAAEAIVSPRLGEQLSELRPTISRGSAGGIIGFAPETNSLNKYERGTYTL